MSDPVIDPEQEKLDREKEVEAQIESELDKYYPSWRSSEERKNLDITSFMNNFWAYFPGKEKQTYKSSHHDQLKDWDIPNRQPIEGIKNESRRQEELTSHSQKWLDQTSRQFQEELLKSAEEVGISQEEIEGLIDAHVMSLTSELGKESGFGKKLDPATVVKYFFPIYKKMRVKGYVHDSELRR
ncbi:MAG: hypothetical protein WC764_02880 [Candidatus Paceibacterota bacterium]|jgi:hypothetical protein